MAFPLLAAFSTSFAPLGGVSIPKVATGERSLEILSSKGTTVLVLSTYSGLQLMRPKRCGTICLASRRRA